MASKVRHLAVVGVPTSHYSEGAEGGMLSVEAPHFTLAVRLVVGPGTPNIRVRKAFLSPPRTIRLAIDTVNIGSPHPRKL